MAEVGVSGRIEQRQRRLSYRTLNDAFQRHYLAVAPDAFRLERSSGDIVGR